MTLSLRWKYVLLASASLAIHSAALAQEANEQTDSQESTRALPTVTVTAQRTEESLQSVPIAITAVGGEQMQDMGITDVDALALQSPGVNIKSDFGAANPNIFIRGVGISDFNANVTGAVGVYVDEVYTASPAAQLFQFFDADRVEILRGPQGTLYGRNTTAGAVNFISRKPTDELSANLYTEYGNYNAITVDGGVGGPIIPGRLKGRIAGTLSQRDGTLDNTFKGGQAPEKLNNRDSWGLRGQLEFTPSDTVTLLGTLYSGSSDASALQSQHRGLLDPATFAPCVPAPRASGVCIDPLGYSDTDGDSFSGAYNDPSKETVDFWGATLKADIDLGDYALTSVTAYQDVDRYTIFDGDQSPISFVVPVHDPESDQFSEEIRLVSPTDNRFRWIAGAFYFKEDLTFHGSFDLFRDVRPAIEAAAATLTPEQLALSPGGFVNGYNPLGSADLAAALGNPVFAFPAQIIEYGYDQNVKTWALFGQTYFDITKDLTLTLGLRYSEEDRTFDYLSETVEGAIRIPLVQTSAAMGNDTTSFDDLSYRAALEWQATDSVFLYGSVSQASKSGGFNGAALLFQPQSAPFGDETLTAYEAGIKTDLFDKALRLNATAFYYDYEDLQVYVIVNSGGLPQQVLTNAASAKVSGLELEALAQPIENLQLSLGAALLDSEFEDFKVPATLGLALQDFTGNSLPYSPELSLNAAATYRVDLSNGGTLKFGGDIAYQDKAYVDPGNTERLATDNYTLVGLHATYQPPRSNWEFGLWGRNVTDEEYISYTVDLSDFGLDYVQFGEPATYGVSVRFTY